MRSGKTKPSPSTASMMSRPSLPKIEPRESSRLRRSSVIRPSASRRLGASKGANTCKSVSHCEPLSWSRWNFQWNSRPANLSPSRFSRQNLSHSRCQSRREHPRLHLAHCRLPCLEVGKHGVEVALRGAVASRPIAGGSMQGFLLSSDPSLGVRRPRTTTMPHKRIAPAASTQSKRSTTFVARDTSGTGSTVKSTCGAPS